MPCLVALVVLGILSIFSAKYRTLAKEAFDCVFRRVTLRPCNTGFDVKVKSAVLAKVLVKSPRAAKWINKNFELLVWVFMVVFTLSGAYSIQSVYNYWAWGDCNGPFATGGFCAFDPNGNNSKTSESDEVGCKDVGIASRSLSREGFKLELFNQQLNGEKANAHVIMLGCYSCDYTRKLWPIWQILIDKYKFNWTFAHFPVKKESEYLQAYDVCVAQQGEDKFWEYVKFMFESSKADIAKVQWVDSKLDELGVDRGKLRACLNSEATQKTIAQRQSQMLNTGIYGTPTVFINGTAVVGPKPIRVYERLLRGGWF